MVGHISKYFMRYDQWNRIIVHTNQERLLSSIEHVVRGCTRRGRCANCWWCIYKLMAADFIYSNESPWLLTLFTMISFAFKSTQAFLIFLVPSNCVPLSAIKFQHGNWGEASDQAGTSTRAALLFNPLKLGFVYFHLKEVSCAYKQSNWWTKLIQWDEVHTNECSEKGLLLVNYWFTFQFDFVVSMITNHI